ncbi:hypothetical protein PIB30_029117 [Stylosanthes scabra]|uniref:CCHC-type domain-containing protein n=1 Tax=Stylosanthes scabra TaxID=79078 RepID=A0ABU6V999_9FABA|nr:hypothetical protein [Stylosanthes scabra]
MRGRKRKCTSCGDAGHTKRSCAIPENESGWGFEAGGSIKVGADSSLGASWDWSSTSARGQSASKLCLENLCCPICRSRCKIVGLDKNGVHLKAAKCSPELSPVAVSEASPPGLSLPPGIVTGSTPVENLPARNGDWVIPPSSKIQKRILEICCARITRTNSPVGSGITGDIFRADQLDHENPGSSNEWSRDATVVTFLALRNTQRNTQSLEKLNTVDSSRLLCQLSKLEPVPKKSDNIQNENPQPMDSQYG